MRRTFLLGLVVSVGLLGSGLAATPQEVMQRHRQALSANPDLLFNLSSVRLVGQIEKYGLRGDAGVFVVLPERFALAHDFPLFSEKWVARGKDGELLEMTGWRRTASRGDLFHLRALQFILGYQYLNPDTPPPTDFREEGDEINMTIQTVEGVPIRVVFDPATNLIRSFAFTGKDGAWIVMHIEAYRLWEGLQVPVRVREESLNPALYSFTQFDLNQSIDGAFFTVTPTPDDHNLPERTTLRIPLQRYFGMPLIKCWIGNSPALTFLVDTALPFSVIDRSIGGQLGFTPQGRCFAATRYPLGEMGIIRVPAVLLREVEFRNKLFLTANMIPPSANVQMPIHGILGADFFRSNIVNLDLSGESLRLISTRGFSPSDRWSRLPLLTAGGTLALIASVDGTETVMELASSYGDSLGFSAASGSARALLRAGRNTAEGFSVGLAHGLPETIISLDTLSLGEQTIRSPLCHLIQFPADNPLARRQNGWLGGNLLRRFSVYLDIPGQAAYLEPNAAVNDADLYNTAGFYPVRSGGKLVVQRVVPDTPAAKAGIEAGDVIVQMMGYPGEQIIFDRVYGFLYLAPGQTLQLQIQKADGSLKDLQLNGDSRF
jgi:hypothetical protein